MDGDQSWFPAASRNAFEGYGSGAAGGGGAGRDNRTTAPLAVRSERLAARIAGGEPSDTDLLRPLVAAADPSVKVAAVVSRGGRPDLAGESLTKVRAPTLLIGADMTKSSST